MTLWWWLPVMVCLLPSVPWMVGLYHLLTE